MNLVKEDFYISRQKAILKEYYANNTFSDAEELKQIRDEIQSRHKKAVDEGNSIYDQVDIDKMMENDFAVRRFLVSVSGSVPKAIEKIDKCFRWRKEFKVNTTTEADLPIEFVKAGAVFPYLEDKTGRLVVYVRVKVNKKIPKLSPFFRQFFVGVVNKVDEIAEANGFTLIFDFSGAGFSNVDMDFLKFILTTMSDYYPGGLKLLVAYNFPRILKTFWAMASAVMSKDVKEKLKFLNGGEIKEHIDEGNLPKYLGGCCKVNFLEVPEECQPVEKIGKLHGFTDKEIGEYLQMFEPHIKEAQKLVKMER